MHKANTINEATFEALRASIPADQPVYMLNLIKYKEKADYGTSTNDYPPLSGREAYHSRYVSGFVKMAGESVKVMWFGSVHGLPLVCPPGEQYEDLAIVQYPNFEAFYQLLNSESYKKELLPHRNATIEDWRLMATARIPYP